MYKIMFALALSMSSANADVITGVTAAATTESLSSTAFNLVDGSGLTGNLHGSFPNGQMWLSGATTPQSVVFDLGAVYDVSQLKVWNYNEAGDSPNPGDALVNLGANAVSVTYGTTLSGFTLGGATGTVGSITSFAKANGASDYTGESFNAQFQARYVKFDITSNYEHPVFNSVGLSEVQFVGTSSAPIQPQGSTLYDPAEPYDVNLPVYPVSYSEEQKQAQRTAGIALINGFRDAINAQQTEYHAQPGVYRLPKGSNFSVGQHTSPFTLYLSDCQIIYEDLDNPLFYLWRVGSFTIVGPVKVDCDPLPYSQGRIVASDYEQRRITVDILPGYRALEAGTKTTEVFYAYSPAGIWLPNRSWSQFEWKDAELSAGGRTVTFSTGNDLTRDYWDRLYSPGNLAALGHWPTWLFILDEVANVTVQDLDFYGGLFCYGNASETTTMTRVRGRRCPGTNRLYGGGGWQSNTRKGRVTLDSCEFGTSYDDLLDMASSMMAMVWQQTSAREIVVWDGIWHAYQIDEPGSPFEFYGKDFTPITSAKLVAAQRVPDTEAEPWIAPAAELIRTELNFSAPTGYRAFWRLTFDKDLILNPGTLVEDVADRQMELVMRNCVWSDAGVRVMIESGKRLQLTNNHFVRIAGGLDVKTESWWWQGATVNNVLIADNVFLDCNYGALWGSGSAAISVSNATEPILGYPERYPNNNIVIRNNRIEGSSAGAILVQNSNNVQITGNECRNLFQLKPPTAAIHVEGSGNLTITGNRVENCPATAIKADWIDGLQCNGNTASNLGTPENPAVMEEFSHVRRATKLIGGVTATATTEDSYRSASQIVDGSGLTGNQHDTYPNGAMWSSGNSPTQSVVFDLGALYDVRQLNVWNYNEAGDFPNPGDACVKAGVKDVRVTYGTTISGFTLGGATGTVGSLTSFAQASGLNTYTGETFSAPFQARYVKFDITSNHGHPVFNSVGLSEVQFVGALAGSDNGWSPINWTNDSSLSFINSSNVTHSGDFATSTDTAATINGFTFETIPIAALWGTLAVPYSGSNFTIGSSASPTTYTGSAGVSGTASSALSSGLIVGPANFSVTYNLTGLSTNTNYEFYFFSPDYGYGESRTGVLDGSDDSGNTFAINQTGGTGDKIIKYAYNTGASTSFTMTVTSTDLHQYAFVNVASAAGTWNTFNWTNDSSLSIITNFNVTHSGEFATSTDTAATINGFTFETIPIAGGFGTLAVPYSGSNFTIGSSASPTTYTGSAGVSGTASSALSSGLIVGPANFSVTYNLTGLSTNTNYEFYFFSPDYGYGESRTGVLDGSDDSGNTFAINQTGGTGDKIIKYAYNTGASTSFTMTVTSSADLHQYAFVNVASPDGIWNTTTDGALWTLDTNWIGNVIADGAGKTAAFNQVDIMADTTVSLNGDRTIGNLIFGDADPATGGSWILDGGGGALTLAGTTPTITVNALGWGKSVTINAGLVGASGFTKEGLGTLNLSGGTSNTLSGPITVSAGMLGSSNSASLQNMTGDITVASGATFDANASFGASIANNFVLSGTGSGIDASGALNIWENANLTGAITLAADTLITHDWNYAYVSGSITGTNTNLELKTLQTSQPGFFMSGPISLGTGSMTLTGIGTVQSADFNFSGTLSYTGETVITSGTMRLSGTARLADSSTVRITSGAVLDLDFAGTDTVAELYIGGLQKLPGTYASLASTADNKSDDFEGEGILQVGGVANNYTFWANSQVPPVSGGTNGDDDNDGVENLVEYALTNGGERGVLSGNTITFTKRGAPYGSDLTYIIETSETLSGPWMDKVTQGPAELGLPISYELNPLPGTPKKFVRLKVVRVP